VATVDRLADFVSVLAPSDQQAFLPVVVQMADHAVTPWAIPASIARYGRERSKNGRDRAPL